MGVASEPSSGGSERELFLAALEKNSPRERTAFLEAACGHDRALRQRLESLLGEEEAMGGFLETPALASPRVSSPPPSETMAGDTVHVLTITEKPGDCIGRYKLLQHIGEGGAGVVYMAEQEEPVRRRVALKVIRLGMDTPSVIARFEAERQALAMMDHQYNAGDTRDAGRAAGIRVAPPGRAGRGGRPAQ
jgi:eukaryotic-like serine/threonine-protein kinase